MGLEENNFPIATTRRDVAALRVGYGTYILCRYYGAVHPQGERILRYSLSLSEHVLRYSLCEGEHVLRYSLSRRTCIAV